MSETVYEIDRDTKENENIEDETKDPNHAGIQVTNVTKRWGSTHTSAIDGLSFNAFPEQVFFSIEV